MEEEHGIVRLGNPPMDIHTFAHIAYSAGYQCTLALNKSKEKLKEIMTNFCDEVYGEPILFYYSGHGIITEDAPGVITK